MGFHMPARHATQAWPSVSLRTQWKKLVKIIIGQIGIDDTEHEQLLPLSMAAGLAVALANGYPGEA